MCIDVIGAVLGVVLEHQDQRAVPDRGVRDRLHDLAERPVVVGDICGWGAVAGSNALGVVQWQREVVERRHCVVGHCCMKRARKQSKRECEPGLAPAGSEES